jgi:putative ABC transport system substrate-binding protein
MRRREFIAGFGSAAWPVVARAEQPRMPIIGFLGAESPENSTVLASFPQGLKEIGFVPLTDD